ncbi:alpha/beta hydrolase [Sodalis-like endosymbiont of Proechinophthirus fluctus]|uniref:alpha/beta hydrolase n=1 Tax=Sodalis-like endosymbiont of Proechinophthirus fluctus TaxID=1462730 RepID=UPI001FCA8152|nr:alpha/beta hydrolase [Sodalis-like endosymbiont of Proechinophthirus fluctus]
MRYYTDYPELQTAAPSTPTTGYARRHWTGSSCSGAQEGAIIIPVLFLSAREDKIVDNRSHLAFCKPMALAGHLCENNDLIMITGARHEILFETDPLRAQVFTLIAHFFMQNH